MILKVPCNSNHFVIHSMFHDSEWDRQYKHPNISVLKGCSVSCKVLLDSDRQEDLILWKTLHTESEKLFLVCKAFYVSHHYHILKGFILNMTGYVTVNLSLCTLCSHCWCCGLYDPGTAKKHPILDRLLNRSIMVNLFGYKIIMKCWAFQFKVTVVHVLNGNKKCKHD